MRRRRAMQTPLREKDQIELSLLKRFGLRISILEAWEGSLRAKGISVPPAVSMKLSRARVKVSSGCFSACDVGSELGRIEGSLVSAAGSLGEEEIEPWLEFLAECMSEEKPVEEMEKNTRFPAIKMYFNRFNFDGPCGVWKT